MSYTEDVASFMHILGPFYEAVYDGQEPENLRRKSPSPHPSEGADKEDESGYSSSLNGAGTEETGIASSAVFYPASLTLNGNQGRTVINERPLEFIQSFLVNQP